MPKWDGQDLQHALHQQEPCKATQHPLGITASFAAHTQPGWPENLLIKRLCPTKGRNRSADMLIPA